MNTSTFIKTCNLNLAKYSFVTDEHFAHEGAWYKQHHVGNIEAVEPSMLNSLDYVSTTTKSRWLPADGD